MKEPSEADAGDPSRPLFTVISPAALADLLRRRGFRAEAASDQNGAPVIRSASSGVQYHVRFGNRAAEGERLYYDFAYVCLIQLDAPVPEGLVAAWNSGKRFSRMHQHDRLLVLEMDVLVAGGVTDGHLLTGLEIWDRLLQEVVAMLRAAAQAAPSAQGSAKADGGSADPAGTDQPS